MEVLFAQQGAGSAPSPLAGFLPFILIMLVIYFLMIRPQMKQQKKKREMMEKLEKGDRVVTAGGVRGTIAGFKEKNSVVVLTVDKNVAIEVNKSAISGLIEPDSRGKKN